MTYLRTYLLTWIGARDTCVSKKNHWTLINLNHSVCGCLETLCGQDQHVTTEKEPKSYVQHVIVAIGNFFVSNLSFLLEREYECQLFLQLLWK